MRGRYVGEFGKTSTILEEKEKKNQTLKCKIIK